MTPRYWSGSHDESWSDSLNAKERSFSASSLICFSTGYNGLSLRKERGQCRPRIPCGSNISGGAVHAFCRCIITQRSVSAVGLSQRCRCLYSVCGSFPSSLNLVTFSIELKDRYLWKDIRCNFLDYSTKARDLFFYLEDKRQALKDWRLWQFQVWLAS